MVAARTGYRRNAIGISAGLGIALPLAAYAATLPLDGVNDVVRADAMPFAVGVVAGVGMLALTGHLLDVHADRVAAEEEEAARFDAIYHGESSAAQASSKAETHAGAVHQGRRFSRNATPSGVPVISRAIDALDEAEAWAEIDAMFSDDSPFSCDPARSKDMYQIALEELRKAERAAAQGGQGSSAASDAGTVSHQGAAECASKIVEPSAEGMDYATAAVDLDEVDARNCAMASLYGDAAGAPSYAPVLPTMSGPGVQHAGGVGASAQGEVLVCSEAPHEAPAVVDSGVSVPIADYSGHEDMWAAALAVLEEPAPLPVAPIEAGNVVQSAQAPIAEAPAGPSVTAQIDARRASAVAEGHMATHMHSHVNALIEEEFNKVPSKSVHGTAHEYLKVIEGGTMAMPALQSVEA